MAPEGPSTFPSRSTWGPSCAEIHDEKSSDSTEWPKKSLSPVAATTRTRPTVVKRLRMCGGSKIEAAAERHSSSRTQFRSAGVVVVCSDTRAMRERSAGGYKLRQTSKKGEGRATEAA